MELEKLVASFYTALQNRDAATMCSCYHDEVIFEDPAFGTLQSKDAKKMWHMLCANAKNFKVIHSDITIDNQYGKAHWEAWYDFSQTGRKVHNIIDASFEFKDGKIIKHIDHFNLHKWASQAMGFKGWLLGGTGFFKKKLQQQTHKSLSKFSTD